MWPVADQTNEFGCAIDGPRDSRVPAGGVSEGASLCGRFCMYVVPKSMPTTISEPLVAMVLSTLFCLSTCLAGRGSQLPNAFIHLSSTLGGGIFASRHILLRRPKILGDGGCPTHPPTTPLPPTPSLLVRRKSSVEFSGRLRANVEKGLFLPAAPPTNRGGWPWPPPSLFGWG